MHVEKYGMLLSDRRLMFFDSKAEADIAMASRDAGDGKVFMRLPQFSNVEIAAKRYSVETIALAPDSGRMVETIAGRGVECIDAQTGEAFHIYSKQMADDEHCRAWQAAISRLTKHENLSVRSQIKGAKWQRSLFKSVIEANQRRNSRR